MKALDSFKEDHSPHSYNNYTKGTHCKNPYPNYARNKVPTLPQKQHTNTSPSLPSSRSLDSKYHEKQSHHTTSHHMEQTLKQTRSPYGRGRAREE